MIDLKPLSTYSSKNVIMNNAIEIFFGNDDLICITHFLPSFHIGGTEAEIVLGVGGPAGRQSSFLFVKELL
jgi:hypothetical protein